MTNTERKIVSWRVSQHPSSDKLNRWCDSQSNINESISNIVLHMIEHFGYKNITDYDIQKALYLGFKTDSSNELSETFQPTDIPALESKGETIETILERNDNSHTKKIEQTKDESLGEEDDFYKDLNIDNL
ncbi:hypothetical protein MXL46_14000 [Heyndrickxia sporothermodurans]|uniref:hypothetical protein n=1 Tax=Heyndrickxia sporothermodurans TaxID=46224 RepID=UPI002DBCD8F5|nr:hypothetical protein [Heyndrickxia sporothermodurans]MEB6550204.1 hypothetical protein [Heyndrickxia sporothermodurans]